MCPAYIVKNNASHIIYISSSVRFLFYYLATHLHLIHSQNNSAC